MIDASTVAWGWFGFLVTIQWMDLAVGIMKAKRSLSMHLASGVFCVVGILAWRVLRPW